ncbi:Uncharacterised protein [Mycobacteroides abscessus]|nr:Uncharacterised protein [Mycobacteroides abscessus]SHX19851.1 Uncharacterised protein [Mycobacteroides abscessus subsp. abscessus]SIA12086.1 Uncharacterised protein [Mycobacteroides abscessus subsp. abscessus]
MISWTLRRTLPLSTGKAAVVRSSKPLSRSYAGARLPKK